MISAETTLPSAEPLRVIAHVEMAEALQFQRGGRPGVGRRPHRLSLRHEPRGVAVSSPERCICQVIWSRTQPEYIA